MNMINFNENEQTLNFIMMKDIHCTKRIGSLFNCVIPFNKYFDFLEDVFDFNFIALPDGNIEFKEDIRIKIDLTKAPIPVIEELEKLFNSNGLRCRTNLGSFTVSQKNNFKIKDGDNLLDKIRNNFSKISFGNEDAQSNEVYEGSNFDIYINKKSTDFTVVRGNMLRIEGKFSEDYDRVVEAKCNQICYDYIETFKLRHSTDDGIMDLFEILNISVGIISGDNVMLNAKVFLSKEPEGINLWSGKDTWIKELEEMINNSDKYIIIERNNKEIKVNENNMKDYENDLFKKLNEVYEKLSDALDDGTDYIFSENSIANALKPVSLKINGKNIELKFEYIDINNASEFGDPEELYKPDLEQTWDFEKLHKEIHGQLNGAPIQISELLFCEFDW